MALEKPLYATKYGAAYLGDSLDLLDQLKADSIDLVITSPPLPYSAKRAMVTSIKRTM